MDQVGAFLEALTTLSPKWIDARFARCVVRDALESNQPPKFLYTSGKPGRYNPAGVQCVYFSERLEVALQEFLRYADGLGLPPSPFTVYYAEAHLPYLDLTDPEICATLGSPDPYASWRLSQTAVDTQLLGAALARQERFAAIRYPSDAARSAKTEGANYVIFRESIHPPAFLKVLTGNLAPVQEWP